ncbi:hypothetical protein L0337_13750 [candidate division KSB1 bacterium]|nr:hypothetical protein [candidate division KSB1 bacterium]
MFQRIFVLIAFGFTLMFLACSEQTPTAPDFKQSEQETGVAALAKGRSTRFAAEVDLSDGILNPECLEVFPDGSVKLNGCQLAGPVTKDLKGTATAIVTGRQDAVGNGRFRGTLTLDVSMGDLSGTFEGRFQGKWTAGIAEGKIKAQGTGGFEGMKMKATFLEQGDPPGTSVYTVTGRIVKGEDGDDDDDDEGDDRRKHGGN